VGEIEKKEVLDYISIAYIKATVVSKLRARETDTPQDTRRVLRPTIHY
jgi:hypothetical protein